MIEFEAADDIAVVTIDDGKLNVLSLGVIGELQRAIDRAVAESAAGVVLAGRPGVLSAGLDLAAMKGGPSEREQLRDALIGLLVRIAEFDQPIVVACTGHAIAAGAALLVAPAHRVGARGQFKLGFNEATVGVTISPVTTGMARLRMPDPWFESLATGDLFTPDGAVEAGLLDGFADPDEVVEAAVAATRRLSNPA